ncbi:MAG: hypothetical protein JF607_16300 [Burkholderiales bacterium]|jgi:hypothetical protein|nr:hypothetical protein [Burkholderiales bacterium]MBW8893396.1 hypothetical protein [Burkholderiales bacterium]
MGSDHRMGAPLHLEIQFGSASECVRFELPESLADMGRDFISAEIVLPRFRGEIRPWIEFDSLQTFTASLRRLYDNLSGSAELRPREEQLVLRFDAQPAGHILLRGEAWAEATYGSCLSFELELDQSFLLAPLQTLEAMLKR